MSRYPDRYSPVFDPNHPKPETGRLHDWQQHDGGYYGSAYVCGTCGEKSWGWNLWKENLQPTCVGRKEPMDDRMVSVCCEAEATSELDGILGQCSRCGENTTFEPDTWTEEEIASIKADMDYAEWKDAGKPGRIGTWRHTKHF